MRGRSGRRPRRGQCPGARAGSSRRSRLRRSFHHEVLRAPAARGPVDEDEDAVAGLELGEGAVQRGGISDGLLAELDNDVAPPETGTVAWAAGHDVGDEETARDPEV